MKKVFWGLAMVMMSAGPCMASQHAEGDYGFYFSGKGLGSPKSSNYFSASGVNGNGGPFNNASDPKFVFANDVSRTYEPKFKVGKGAGIAFGMFNGRARAEFETHYASIVVDTEATDPVKQGELSFYPVGTGALVGSPRINFKIEDIKLASALANVYLDIFDGDTPISIYLGAGTGLTRLEILGETGYFWSLQGMAGASYPILPSTRFFAGYKLLTVFAGDGIDITKRGTQVTTANPPYTGPVTNNYQVVNKSQAYVHFGEAGILHSLS